MITHQKILEIANLAKLKVTSEDAEIYATQLSQALDYFQQISSINTEGVMPLVSPIEMNQFWREDDVEKEFNSEQILSNAPEKTGMLFTVPPVV